MNKMKVKVWLYTTKQAPYLVKNESEEHWYTMQQFELDTFKNVKTFNGKIVAECDYEVEEIKSIVDDVLHFNWYETETMNEGTLLGESCLNPRELDNYLKCKNGKAIHIKNLHIFDTPKELNECHKKYDQKDYSPIYYMPIDHAPQNMMKVWVYENGEWVIHILISIRSKWMCKILNKEKNIEIRKVVLKEMINNG